jgi:polar amino acid transport system substrate-binding protein
MLALYFLIAGLLLAGQSHSVRPALGSTLSVRWNDDPPYSMTDSRDRLVGIDVDLTTEILSRMGYGVNFVKMPFARALRSLEAGVLDILPGAFIRPEREVFASFAQAQFVNNNVLFETRTALIKWKLARLADLKGSGFRLGVQIEVSYGQEFDALAKDPEFAKLFVPVAERAQLWRMAAVGRLDGVIADEVTARFELSQAGLSDQILASGVVVSEANEEPATFAFSKKTVDASFVEQFNKIQRTLLKDGMVARILKKYL